MDITKLRGKFLIMQLWAHRFHIHDFPKKLSSLETDNHTPEMIQKDYKILPRTCTHHIPAHTEIIRNELCRQTSSICLHDLYYSATRSSM